MPEENPSPELADETPEPSGPASPDATPSATELAPALLAAWLLICALLMKVVVARFLVLGSLGPAEGFVADLALFTLALAPGLLIGGRAGAAWIVVVDLLLAGVVFVASVYVSYFEVLPSIAMLSVSGQVAQVSESVGELLTPEMLLVLIDLPLVVAGVWEWRRARFARSSRYALSAVLVSAIVAGMSVFSLLGAPGVPGEIDAARARGIVFAAVVPRAAEAAAEEPATLVEAGRRELTARERVDRIMDRDPALASIVASGPAQGRSIIVVQLESVQTAAIDSYVDGVEITPNLNRFVRDSWYYPNTVSMIARGNTSDAEFAIASSLLPNASSPSAVAWADRELPSLPRVLNDAGYVTETFHTNRASFWNRRELYASLGYSKYYDRSWFGNADRVGMGPSDDVLFGKSVERIQELHDEEQPFLAFLVTLSSHHTFRAVTPERSGLVLPPVFEDTPTGRYLTSIHYADASFGRFIDDLKKRGIYDDVVIVVVGDHFGVRAFDPVGADKTAQQMFLGTEYTIQERTRVPLMIRVPGQDPERFDDSASQLDIAPTVAGLVGVGLGNRPVFGRDLRGSARTLIPLHTGNYVTEDAFVVPGFEYSSPKALPFVPGVPPSDPQRQTFKDSRALRWINDVFVRDLPRRSDARTDEDAVIPTDPDGSLSKEQP